ncbi:hypothetical protein [Lactobacillus intestinalis]|uniref:hypothetical protein n=1 Tax=Lactobacillus intestinalis TaxID=151781 RepID=UPI0025B5BEC1|nr:hypothetical protein [Lactobacillus intestinalis]
MFSKNENFKPLRDHRESKSSEVGVMQSFKRSSAKMVVKNPYVKVEKPVYSRIIEVYKGK